MLTVAGDLYETNEFHRDQTVGHDANACPPNPPEAGTSCSIAPPRFHGEGCYWGSFMATIDDSRDTTSSRTVMNTRRRRRPFELRWLSISRATTVILVICSTAVACGKTTLKEQSGAGSPQGTLIKTGRIEGQRWSYFYSERGTKPCLKITLAPRGWTEFCGEMQVPEPNVVMAAGANLGRLRFAYGAVSLEAMRVRIELIDGTNLETEARLVPGAATKFYIAPFVSSMRASRTDCLVARAVALSAGGQELGFSLGLGHPSPDAPICGSSAASVGPS
jgi:hypothetical protein